VVSDVINRCKSSLLMCEEENLLDVDLSAYGKLKIKQNKVNE
jgi:hypothetical protein